MLKKISVEHLTLGMHLHEFCGSWMEHPFWRTKFVLRDQKDLDAVRASSIRQVWIDVSKGLDTSEGVTQEANEAEVDRELQAAAAAEKPAAQEKTSMREEAARAARICAKSKQAVVSMFQEARMGKAVDAKDCAPLVEEISNSIARNPGALISLARLKTADDYTYMHSVAVCALMIALARQLGLDDEQTRQAGLSGLLQGSGVPEMALDVCLHHHEKTDGSGYPKGLKANEISLFAKMGAVCDVYDAITSNRPYKAGWDPAESLRKMAEWSKGHFDEAVFQAFVKSLGIYPTGSLVLLASGRIGVVTEQSEKSLLAPKVKVFFSTKSNVRIKPEIIDLSRPGVNDKITGREDPAKWNFPDLNELWAGAALPS